MPPGKFRIVCGEVIIAPIMGAELLGLVIKYVTGYDPGGVVIIISPVLFGGLHRILFEETVATNSGGDKIEKVLSTLQPLASVTVNS